MSAALGRLSIDPVRGIPLVRPGDDLATLLGDAIDAAGLAPRHRDVLVVTHKVVSKAEGRYVVLSSVTPSPEARRLARRTAKDPRLVELILRESRAVLRARPGLIISEHRLGSVMANAGIDRSNVPPAREGERVLLLPVDPDASAERVRGALARRFGVQLAVVVSDSVGRAWRNGVVGLALGVAGLPALVDLRGRRDLDGRALEVTQVALADAVACAAVLVMGEADEGCPAVRVRGLQWQGAATSAAALVRPREEDLFR